MTDWTLSEFATLQRGVEIGLSWAAIAKSLPRRRPWAIRKQAVDLGLVRDLPGAWPQIADHDEPVEAEIPDDPLLDRLQRCHGHPDPVWEVRHA